ncbi:MAG: L,D-transpeptidase [Pseudomonadota bacterium]|nr:L,D-transpeptidase [Pseudomonadota bacterium]
MLVRTAIALAALFFGTVAHAEPLDDTGLTVEVLRLRQAFRAEVRQALHPDPAREQRSIDLARAAIADSNETIDHPQLVAIVDRNPRQQQLMVAVAMPGEPWRVIGTGSISTGQTGRFDHYVTPIGVFHVTDAILGYRAEGTLNENGIRGLGAKGMRVWDFGWQVAKKGWIETVGKPDSTPIRFMLHATDPDKLEQRLGRPASQGCIRMPGTMNRFLDLHGVLDSEYERAAQTEIRFRALLLPVREPSPLAGNTLIVVDSAPHPAAPLQAAVRPAPDSPHSGGTAPTGAPGRS